MYNKLKPVVKLYPYIVEIKHNTSHWSQDTINNLINRTFMIF